MAISKVSSMTAHGALADAARETSVARLVKWIEFRRARRHTIKELGALSDRQLQDLGFERALLPELVDSRLQADLARIGSKIT